MKKMILTSYFIKTGNTLEKSTFAVFSLILTFSVLYMLGFITITDWWQKWDILQKVLFSGILSAGAFADFIIINHLANELGFIGNRKKASEFINNVQKEIQKSNLKGNYRYAIEKVMEKSNLSVKQASQIKDGLNDAITAIVISQAQVKDKKSDRFQETKDDYKLVTDIFDNLKMQVFDLNKNKSR